MKPTEQKHTPWRATATHCNPTRRYFRTVIRSENETIAETLSSFLVDRSADEARLTSMNNARLIAAAPCLLAALEEIVDKIEWMGQTVTFEHDSEAGPALASARAAIAKAKGQG